MELVDLTLPLGPGLSVQPGDPALHLKRTSTCETDGYEVTQIRLGSHTGTHVEAPRHFYPEGLPLDAFPITRFVGHGTVLDCRQVTGHREDESAAVHGLAEQLRWWPPVEDGIVLLWTEGGTLPMWAAETLAAAKVGMVGIDSPSVDEEPYPVHHFLLARGILIAEGLTNLDQVGAGPADCAVLPLALEGTDASPARAVAWRPKRTTR